MRSHAGSERSHPATKAHRHFQVAVRLAQTTSQVQDGSQANQPWKLFGGVARPEDSRNFAIDGTRVESTSIVQRKSLPKESAIQLSKCELVQGKRRKSFLRRRK
jgi:hypothetical protein